MSKRIKMRCSGGMYSEDSIIEQPTTAAAYGWRSAVCDQCGTRLYLKYSRLPLHHLTVSIHEVHGPVHKKEVTK